MTAHTLHARRPKPVSDLERAKLRRLEREHNEAERIKATQRQPWWWPEETYGSNLDHHRTQLTMYDARARFELALYVHDHLADDECPHGALPSDPNPCTECGDE